MLHSITPPNTSSKPAFTWVTNLLAQRQIDIVSRDEATGRIETPRAVFLVIERGAEVDFSLLGTEFAQTMKQTKHLGILAPDLTDSAINAIRACDYPGFAADYHRKHALFSKVTLATSNMSIERAITEMTHENKALEAFATVYGFQERFWGLLIVVLGTNIERYVHAPTALQGLTFALLMTLAIVKFIVWIAGRRRVSAAHRRRHW